MSRKTKVPKDAISEGDTVRLKEFPKEKIESLRNFGIKNRNSSVTATKRRAYDALAQVQTLVRVYSSKATGSVRVVTTDGKSAQVVFSDGGFLLPLNILEKV